MNSVFNRNAVAFGFVGTLFCAAATPSWGAQMPADHDMSELQDNVNENRVTASGTYNLPFDNNNWATIFAWGRKMDNPGHDLDGFLLESEVVLHDTHTFFGRAERVGEDELFDGSPTLGNQVITVNKLSVGYIRDCRIADHSKFGVGGSVRRYAYPTKSTVLTGLTLHPTYCSWG